MSEKGKLPNGEQKIRLSYPKKVAGGIPAITSSVKHVFREAGFVEGTKLMTLINQFHGFDCPGCAWPDPDDQRSLVEFCENGAKAVAEESTTAMADAAFFRKHSVEELSGWADFEIGDNRTYGAQRGEYAL